MNEQQIELQKSLELKMLCHAMVSAECFEEVNGYNFSVAQYKQTMPEIAKCLEVNGECSMTLLKLSGFNSVELDGVLSPVQHSDIVKVITAAKSSLGRIKLAELLMLSASKMNDYGKSVDVLLNEVGDEIEYLSRTNTPKPLFDMTPLSQIKPVETEWITKDWLPIPKRAVTLITAKGGTGKSYVTLQIMLKFLAGNPDKKAFGWFSEDPIGTTRLRAENICKMLGVDLGVMDRLVIIGSEQEVHHLYNTDGLTSAFMQTKRLLRDCELVVLDPLIGFYGEEENSNSHARAFMNGLNAWVNKENKSIIVIHHSSKSDDDQGGRGAGAFVDAARLSYSLSLTKKVAGKEKSASSDYLFFKIAKDNYGAKYLTGDLEQIHVFPKHPLSDNSASRNEGAYNEVPR